MHQGADNEVIVKADKEHTHAHTYTHRHQFLYHKPLHMLATQDIQAAIVGVWKEAWSADTTLDFSKYVRFFVVVSFSCRVTHSVT